MIVRALFLFLISGPAFAATLTFRNLDAKDQLQLKTDLPRLFDSQPDLSVMDEAIRILMAQGTYENVFVEKTGEANYEIVGKPLRTIEDVQFTGLKEVSESKLREMLDFKIGDRFERKKAVAAGEKMKDYYGEHGFFNTVIELNFEKLDDGNIRLVFGVEEKAPCLIKKLDFITPNTDLKALLNSNFKTNVKKPLTTERIRHLMQELDTLLIDHRYLATEIVGPDAKYNADKTEASLQIEVREPFRYEFYFSGNQFFTMMDVYHALNLADHERKNVEPSGEGAERLRRAYLDKGFPNVQIETKVDSAPGSYLKRITYKINEQQRVKVKQIEVQGRISRVSKYYQDFILHNSSPLIDDGFFNRLDLENGFKNLVTELRNQGFLRARVQSSRMEYSPKKDFVTIYLLLEEGPQTQIRGLDFTGNKFFSSFELTQVTGLETNTPLHLNGFEDSLEKLKSFYRNQGFLEMKLLNEGDDLIQYNDKGTQARIKFQIYEGPRIRVHAISVEGNTKTKTRVILKETDFKLGEILTPQKLETATIRLNRMGLFTRADVHTLEEGTSVSERTLVISISERDPGVVRFGGGLTSERNLTVRGYTDATYNNLWGTARAISGRAEIRENVAEVRYPETEVTAGFLEPFLFNTRTRGRVNVTRSEYVADYEAAAANFTQITIKNRLDLFAERDLSTHHKLTYKVWSLESRQDFERHGYCLPDPNTNADPAAPLPGAGKCPANTMQVATIGPTLDMDYRDSPFLPTRGNFTRIGIDYSNPNFGSSKGVEFIRFDASYSWYTRLGSPRWVWANNVRAGYLANLSRQADSGVPSDYAFVLGGIYTIRGYDLASPNERVPRDGSGVNPNVPGDTGFHLGETNQKLIRSDSNYYLIKSEIRFPLYNEFGGVVFYDGGAVHISGYTFERPYRDAVGFGFRYNTPVGPVALDFAFKINPEGKTATQDAESPFRFQFSIGTF